MNIRTSAVTFAVGIAALVLTGAGCSRAPAGPVVDGALSLAPTAAVLVPDGWKVVEEGKDAEGLSYDLTMPDGQTPWLQAIRVQEWLKGPGVNEGYIIDHDNRPAALQVLQDVYANQAITSVDRSLFADRTGEFLGYSRDRAALTYVENADGSFRGISFYNLRGQDVGTYPVYYVVLYRPESDLIVLGTYDASGSKEAMQANAWIKDVGTLSDSQIQQRDETAKRDMRALLERVSPDELSFSDSLKTVNAFFRGVFVK